MRLLIILIIIVGCAAGCSEEPPPVQPTQPTRSPLSALAKMGEMATDPFAQFELSFEGNPNQDQIREKLDPALSAYGVELTNENRLRLGNALVAIRKETGHSEIAILDKMLSSPPSGTFEEAAARVASEMNK